MGHLISEELTAPRLAIVACTCIRARNIVRANANTPGIANHRMNRTGGIRQIDPRSIGCQNYTHDALTARGRKLSDSNKYKAPKRSDPNTDGADIRFRSIQMLPPSLFTAAALADVAINRVDIH